MFTLIIVKMEVQMHSTYLYWNRPDDEYLLDSKEKAAGIMSQFIKVRLAVRNMESHYGKKIVIPQSTLGS